MAAFCVLVFMFFIFFLSTLLGFCLACLSAQHFRFSRCALPPSFFTIVIITLIINIEIVCC